MNAPRGMRRCVAVAGILALMLPASIASARVDISAGIRYLSPSGTVQDCSAKAKAALEAFIPGATEASPGSGDWLAFGQNIRTGAASSAAAVRCYEQPKGYVVTFTCSVLLPANPYRASTLCLDIAHKFYGGALTPLAAMPTATPVPTGCATTNLVGTWVSDSDSKLTLTMDLTGGLTDNEGVSGNWNLDGTTVTLTYYGTHTLTLSSDGKHIHGGNYSFTRRC